jgi:hypothetical protein
MGWIETLYGQNLEGLQTFRYRTGNCSTGYPGSWRGSVEIIIAAAVTLYAFSGTPANASDIVEPGRFGGYSPIIGLLDGEKVTTLEGGIHGDSFRWEDAFRCDGRGHVSHRPIRCNHERA